MSGATPARHLASVCTVAWLLGGASLSAQPGLPRLTGPVNDFAGVVAPEIEAEIESVIRALERASGDVIVVATVETFAPYADVGEFAVALFENQGLGVGRLGQDNGLLVVLAVEDRQVRVEVGYGLEAIATDGFAGETARQMVPAFRSGDYGAGLRLGVSRLAGRIAEGRSVVLEIRTPAPQGPDLRGPPSVPLGLVAYLLFMVLAGASSWFGQRRRRRRFWYWEGGHWSGWDSGVGPFGGGHRGGFGGFGGGRSGGGGGGAGW